MEQKAVIDAGTHWVEKSFSDFSVSPVRRIGAEWMLITAGDTALGPGNWNTMTAAWGGFGVMWAKDAVFTVIRPGRHTRGFVDSSSIFTLSFFTEAYRTALSFCGEKSGRDYDKASETGLTPIVFADHIAGGKAAGAIAFKEASEILICKKMYFQDFDPANFLDPAIMKLYPQPDYHRMYIGEVLTLLIP